MMRTSGTIARSATSAAPARRLTSALFGSLRMFRSSFVWSAPHPPSAKCRCVVREKDKSLPFQQDAQILIRRKTMCRVLHQCEALPVALEVGARLEGRVFVERRLAGSEDEAVCSEALPLHRVEVGP